MNNLETRKAQLREYIEAREKATQGEWKVDPEHGQDVFANGEGRVLSSDPRWNYAPGKISCYNNLKFASKAANESARIAEQLLELIEASQKVLKIQYGAQGYYEENDWEGLSEYYGNLIIQYQDELRIALNKIAGGK